MLRSLTLLVAISAIAAVGCVDPKGELDKFEARTEDAGGFNEGPTMFDGGTDAGDCQRTPGTSGEYFFTIAPSILENAPVLLEATLTIGADGSTFDAEFRQLSIEDSTLVVGEPAFFPGIPLNSDGSFNTGPQPFLVDADANAFRQDLDVEVTLSGGFLCDDNDFICGVLNGGGVVAMSDQDIPLNGSTFTGQRITDPNNRPTPLKNCEREPPAPIGSGMSGP